MVIKTRVVSATNKDVGQMMEDGLFRKDLFYRLGVIKVEVPSLNKRPEDIIPLSKHFLQEYSLKFAKEFTGISSEAQNGLITHDWTGNIRELKNIIERAVLVGKGPELMLRDLGLDAQDLPAEPSQFQNGIGFPPLPPEGMDLTKSLHALERFYLESALRIAEGNESKAAKLLKMNHHTYRYRRKKLESE